MVERVARASSPTLPPALWRRRSSRSPTAIPKRLSGSARAWRSGSSRQAKVNRSRVIGIGLTLAGQVDAEKGLCRQMQRFGWRDVPIAAMLAEIVSVRSGRQRRQRLRRRRSTSSATRAACRHRRYRARARRRRRSCGAWAALSRWRWGGGRVRPQFPCEGSPLRVWPGRMHRGLLLRCRAARDVGRARSRRTGKVGRGARRGGECRLPVARGVLAEAGIRLGQHVGSLVNVFNPEMIVFGGEGLRFAGHLFDPLREVLDDVCYPGAPPIAFDWELNSWERGGRRSPSSTSSTSRPREDTRQPKPRRKSRNHVR